MTWIVPTLRALEKPSKESNVAGETSLALESDVVDSESKASSLALAALCTAWLGSPVPR